MKNFIKSYTSLLVIIIAALLIELTTGIIYYNSQDIIKRTTVRVMERENIALYLCIRNKLTEVEVVLDNMSWIVTDDLLQPVTTKLSETKRLGNRWFAGACPRGRW